MFYLFRISVKVYNGVMKTGDRRTRPSAAKKAARPPLSRPEPKETTLASAVYQRLADDILTGRLAPGQKLPFDMLRESYGYSVSPLREALQRLAIENWVDAEDHVGFRVAPMSLEDLRDINAMRTLLEPLALRDAVQRGDMAWETRVVGAAHKLARTPIPQDPASAAADLWEEVHREFHEALISACTSRRLLRFCRLLFAQFRRYRRLVLTRYWTSQAVRATVDAEHKRVMDAALGRQADKAAELLAHHYSRSAERVIAEYQKAHPEEPQPRAAAAEPR